jgi:hypothetical protein
MCKVLKFIMMKYSVIWVTKDIKLHIFKNLKILIINETGFLVFKLF